LLSGGRTIKRSGFNVLLKPNALGVPRLGLIVPKRVLPRAVDRNRVKRMVREWFRNNQARLGNCDILVRVTKKVVVMAELELGLAGSW
jgi:ribonuclease P protein component